MVIDDSFKKPGAVPFKWEIRPGVPKIHHQHKKLVKHLTPPTLPSPSTPFQPRHASPTSQPKLKPPPASSVLFSPEEPRSRSFRSTPRARSESWRFEPPTRVQPECVFPGCFPSPSLRRKGSKKNSHRVGRPGWELDYTSDRETLARWSVSSRKSAVLSPFHDSSTTSSYWSNQSSPRQVNDAEWAGFGLF
ncbi:hypothetical protein K2173_028587 [Erythroxylum novogranatense]|uniref:Uncharacterized protein n=1 Tax=Erythroxylum novogranatense TaxID=1862640 RepID=A0AAV8U2I0_9ROSI|nr:hypothetical protein K2173_028587 [Erythroxylum novogranatense]